jgi:hypothetical protein
MSEKVHQSRKETEDRSYERLRKHGVHPDAARQIGREASEITHRKVDSDPNRK